MENELQTIEKHKLLGIARKDVLYRIYDELVEGYTVNDVKKHISEGKYDTYCPELKDYTSQGINHLIKSAIQLYKFDDEDEIQNTREVNHARFMDLYKRAVAKDDIRAAKEILDSLGKLMGLNRQSDEDKNNMDGKVVINFGLGTTPTINVGNEFTSVEVDE